MPIGLAAAVEARSEFALAVEAAELRAAQGGAPDTTAVPAATAGAVAATSLPATAPPLTTARSAERAPAVAATAPPTGTAAAIAAVPAPAAAPAAAAPAGGRYATLANLESALARSSWPVELWPRIISIAGCESGSDTNRDGYKDTFDNQAVGSGAPRTA